VDIQASATEKSVAARSALCSHYGADLLFIGANPNSTSTIIAEVKNTRLCLEVTRRPEDADTD
jgi:hypothetical protein